MKLIKILTVIVFAVSILVSPAFAADKIEAASCCVKFKKEGKECPHKCCIQAKKEGRSCEKCSGKKKE